MKDLLNGAEISRRNFLRNSLVGAGALMAASSGFPVFAEDFPSKPINHIVPAKAGGGWDRSSRVLAEAWEPVLGQPVKFSFSPGASGQIGFGKIRAAKPDGYTTIMMTISMQAMVVKYGKPAADFNDIGFVGNVISDPDCVLIHKDSPWNNLDEFVDHVRNAKEPVTISASHPIASNTFAARVFLELIGGNAKIVPFDGGSAARKALAGKHVDACIAPFFSASNLKEFIKGIGIFNTKNPAPHIWEMPPVNEVLDVTVPNFVEPFAFHIRRDVEKKYPDRYAKLVDTFKEAHFSKKAREKAASIGMGDFMDYWSPSECEAFLKDFQSTLNKYGHLVTK
ncbi:Bug family tripartite tricarboxylate transporter substrate binding protein [Limisalsivibrio acetivorans]|uniref:Bug family tripartite tricarboxylate transporter substrate binding protein n=1 Tax=Limisalsivibrio acetivorans TaxID=1304888 RepID=UPI0003B74800|nr:tripartite tricarboxylate transporter substrate-binding protein [Limisalsivibrio acetivorans]